MEYTEFKEELVKIVKERMEDTGMELFVQTVTKNNNTVKDALSYQKEGCNAAPVIYLDDMYKELGYGNEMEQIAEEIMDIFCSRKDVDFGDIWGEWDKVRSTITYKLVNYDMNEEMLKSVLHRKVMDLAFVPMLIVKEKGDGFFTTKLDERVLRHWKISEEELWIQVFSNLQEEKFDVVSLDELLGSVPDDKWTPNLMYVLTNSKGINGAAGMLSVKTLEAFSKEKGSFYILPSSVHEVLLVPDNIAMEESQLKEMVIDANRLVVSREERLSDEIYYYDARDGKVNMVEMP